MKKIILTTFVFLISIVCLFYCYQNNNKEFILDSSNNEVKKEEDMEVIKDEPITKNDEVNTEIVENNNNNISNNNQNNMESNIVIDPNVIENPKSNNKKQKEEKTSVDKEETPELNKKKEEEIPDNNELDKNSWNVQKKRMEKEGYYNDAFSEEELNKKINTLLSYGYSPSYAPQCTKYKTLGEMCGYHIDAFIISIRVNKCIAPEDISKIKYDDRGYVENTNWRNSQYKSIYKYLSSLGYDCTNVNDPYPL